jgi:hypothetical protein
MSLIEAITGITWKSPLYPSIFVPLFIFRSRQPGSCHGNIKVYLGTYIDNSFDHNVYLGFVHLCSPPKSHFLWVARVEINMTGANIGGEPRLFSISPNDEGVQNQTNQTGAVVLGDDTRDKTELHRHNSLEYYNLALRCASFKCVTNKNSSLITFVRFSCLSWIPYQ